MQPGSGISINENGVISAAISANNTLQLIQDKNPDGTLISQKYRLTGNYVGINGVTVDGNKISANVDNDTIKINDKGQLTST